MILTSTKGQVGLPRYFPQVFDFMHHIDEGRLDFILPDGRRFRSEGSKPGYVAELIVHNNDLFARLIRDGDLGFFEAYMDGWWDTPDLMAFMDFVHHASDQMLDGFPGQAFVRAYEMLRFWLRSNTKRQAKKNISHHYDLGNDFYGLWLDDTMTYSSALFRTGQESLEQAQTQKYAALVDQLDVSPGDHVLEIGCGWGGFAEYAAKERGLRVTGLTLSREQLSYARQRLERAGVSEMVDLRLQDYRDERGRYDGIASIEMFEAVGERYWSTYFNTVRDRLHRNRKATLQIITLQDKRWEVYRKGVDFIQKYIFPGGMLPSPTVLRQEVEKAGLEIDGSFEFGESYSQTLRRWYDRFNDSWPKLAELRFDDRFRRMWNLYLTSCASTFHSGNCDVTQITVTRPS